MKDNEKFINQLKLQIKLKNYSLCIEMLKQEIKNIYINKICELDKIYTYTNMLDLIKKSESLLSDEYVNNLKRFYLIINEQNNQAYECDCLINIYKSVM